MTEKRFTLIDMNNIEKELLSPIKDNGSDCLTWFEVVGCLNALHEEKETYKRLFNEIAYYFRDNIKSLNDLDHKDFESLQLLAQGEYFDEESLCWCKVQLEEIE